MLPRVLLIIVAGLNWTGFTIGEDESEGARGSVRGSGVRDQDGGVEIKAEFGGSNLVAVGINPNIDINGLVGKEGRLMGNKLKINAGDSGVRGRL